MQTRVMLAPKCKHVSFLRALHWARASQNMGRMGASGPSGRYALLALYALDKHSTRILCDRTVSAIYEQVFVCVGVCVCVCVVQDLRQNIPLVHRDFLCIHTYRHNITNKHMVSMRSL